MSDEAPPRSLPPIVAEAAARVGLRVIGEEVLKTRVGDVIVSLVQADASVTRLPTGRRNWVEVFSQAERILRARVKGGGV